jgi:hypothetical protein
MIFGIARVTGVIVAAAGIVGRILNGLTDGAAIAS